MKNLFYLACASLLITSCTNNSVTINQGEEAKKLMDLSRQWAKSASTEEFLSYWNEETLFMGPDKPIVKGQKDIAKELESFFAIPGFKMAWEPHEAYVSESGDLGYVIIKILVTYNNEQNEQVRVFEKGVEIWKRQSDNTWKNVVDIWNTDPSLSSIY